jgi:hypothetical protein
MADP